MAPCLEIGVLGGALTMAVLYQLSYVGMTVPSYCGGAGFALAPNATCRRSLTA
jgi:hypothetical protein